MKRIGPNHTASRPQFGKSFSPRILLKLFNPLVYTKDNIDRFMPRAIDFKSKYGFSFEDLNSRMMVLIAYYIPQGAISIYYQQNPYETWARNALAFAGSVYLTMLAKSPTFGFGRISNMLMLPKKTPDYFKPFTAEKAQEEVDKLKENHKAWAITRWRKDLNLRIAEFFAKISPKLEGIVTYRNSIINAVFKPLRLEHTYLYLLEKHGTDIAQLEFKSKLEKGASKEAKIKEQIEAMREKFYWQRLDNNMRVLLYAERDQLYAQLTGKNKLSGYQLQRIKDHIPVLEKQIKNHVGALEEKILMQAQLARHKELLKPIVKSLTRQQVKEQYRDLSKLLRLLLATQIMNSSLTAIFFTLIVGIWMQALVFKYVSPLDKRLTPRTLKKPPLPNAPPKNFILPQPAGGNPFYQGRFIGQRGVQHAHV